MKAVACLPAAWAIALGALAPSRASAEAPTPRQSLTFHASFDGGPDAELARGDKALYHSSSSKREDPRPGLPPWAEIARGAGRRGDALRLIRRTDEAIFYRAERNVAYAAKDWGGTVSFWLSVDPDKGLDPGYTDPVQITQRAWNDAAFWVDFSDKNPRHLRLGAFSDLKVWNPTDKDFEKMTPEERPMFDAGRPPFAAGKWSHVAFTFERFNSGKADAVATLYIDGRRQGEVSGRRQVYTWEPSKAAIMLGLGFKGLIDEVSVFDRPLTAGEIQAIAETGEIPGPKAP